MTCNSILAFVSGLVAVSVVWCSFRLYEKCWVSQKMGSEVQSIFHLDLPGLGVAGLWWCWLALWPWPSSYSKELTYQSRVRLAFGGSLLLCFREESSDGAVVLLSLISIKENIIVDVNCWSIYIQGHKYIYTHTHMHILDTSNGRVINNPSLLGCWYCFYRNNKFFSLC